MKKRTTNQLTKSETQTTKIKRILKPLDELIEDVLDHVDLDEGGQCLVDVRTKLENNLIKELNS